MGESNTVVSAYTMYGHLQQYCPHLSICTIVVISMSKTQITPLKEVASQLSIPSFNPFPNDKF